jgi:mRNA interferase MazF
LTGRTRRGIYAVTSHGKGYPFEVPLPEGGPISGVVLADHMKSLDWRRRKAARIDCAPRVAHERTCALIGLLLGTAA